MMEQMHHEKIGGVRFLQELTLSMRITIDKGILLLLFDAFL